VGLFSRAGAGAPEMTRLATTAAPSPTPLRMPAQARPDSLRAECMDVDSDMAGFSSGSGGVGLAPVRSPPS